LTGDVGPIGETGAAGSSGATGPAGPGGSARPRGADGIPGSTGAAAASGIGGLSQYAYVYDLGAQVVPIEAGVAFDTNGPMTPGVTHAPGSADIHVVDAGTYKVSVALSGTQPARWPCSSTRQRQLPVGCAPEEGSRVHTSALDRGGNGRFVVTELDGAGGVHYVAPQGPAVQLGLGRARHGPVVALLRGRASGAGSRRSAGCARRRDLAVARAGEGRLATCRHDGRPSSASTGWGRPVHMVCTCFDSWNAVVGGPDRTGGAVDGDRALLDSYSGVRCDECARATEE
jgi:hypothetical protein